MSRIIPWRFAFRRRTLKYWDHDTQAIGSHREKAINAIRDLYIGGLKSCIDRAEQDPTDGSLQNLGDQLCKFGVYIPEALKIFWEPRDKFEQECLQLRKEYVQQLLRVSDLLSKISGRARDVVLVFFAQHCEALNLYWRAPPQRYFATTLPPLDVWQKDTGRRTVVGENHL
jgi:hypothetical protein